MLWELRKWLRPPALGRGPGSAGVWRVHRHVNSVLTMCVAPWDTVISLSPHTSSRENPGNPALFALLSHYSIQAFQKPPRLIPNRKFGQAVVQMAPHYVGYHPLLLGQRHPEIRTKASNPPGSQTLQ